VLLVKDLINGRIQFFFLVRNRMGEGCGIIPPSEGTKICLVGFRLCHTQFGLEGFPWLSPQRLGAPQKVKEPFRIHSRRGKEKRKKKKT
jgi:hypothetical protein